jgi:chromosome segregation ATPase
MFAPEPLITKIIGGAISLLCIAAGGAGKHIIYERDYVRRSLDSAIEKLNEQIISLGEEIQLLKATNKDLREVNSRLKQTKKELQLQVNSLKGEIDRLQSKVVEAFAQLNDDRRDFESHKGAKLKQLVDEIDEADARGDRATKELENLLSRAMELDTLEDELNERRKTVALSEKKLRRLQRKLLSTRAEKPQSKDRSVRLRN